MDTISKKKAQNIYIQPYCLSATDFYSFFFFFLVYCQWLSHFLMSLSPRAEEWDLLVLLLPVSFRTGLFQTTPIIRGHVKAQPDSQTCSFRAAPLLPTFSGTDPQKRNRNILLQLSSMGLHGKSTAQTHFARSWGTTKRSHTSCPQGVYNRAGAVPTRLLLMVTRQGNLMPQKKCNPSTLQRQRRVYKGLHEKFKTWWALRGYI